MAVTTYDPWDLSSYGSAPAPTGTRASTQSVPGSTSYNSGSTRFDYVTPGGIKDVAGQAARAGTVAGGENPYAWLQSLLGQPTTTATATRGGGGSAPPPDYSTWSAWASAAKPQQYSYTPLNLPEYNAPKFYDFSSEPYDVAQGTITDQIAAGTAQGNRTYSDAFTELNQYQNPFGTVRTTNPNVRDSMARMMQANGVNPNIMSGTANEGIQADQAFGNVQSLLAGNADMRQASNLRGLGADQRRFNESMGTEGRLLGAQVQMALAKAKSQYQKDLFMYGKEEADKRYEMAVATATANNQGVNNVNQMNTQNSNTWNSSILETLLGMITNGGTGMPTDPSRVMA